MADKEKLIEKFKKQGVKFNKAGKPTNMEKIYKTNPELHGELIDNFYSTKGTMDDFNLRKFLGNAFKKDKKWLQKKWRKKLKILWKKVNI